MNQYMNKILVILCFTINCFDPLIRDDKEFETLVKQFMAEDDEWMNDIPEDFMPDTGKSFSEALTLASTNPQYDKRLFMELP